MPAGIPGENKEGRECPICKVIFYEFKSNSQKCCGRACGVELSKKNRTGSHWVWNNNRVRAAQRKKITEEKEQNSTHLKTIFTGGYDNEVEKDVILHGYSEGEIL